MVKNFIVCVKGISGSGKSTRVFLVLRFLREVLGMESEPFLIPSEGKMKQCGVLIPELDLIFLGKEYVTGSFGRFQGLDSVTGVFGSNAAISEFLKENSDKYSFFLEGAGTTQSNRFRPKFLYEYCGFTDVMMQYYNYGGEVNHQEYYNRIIYRSGKKPTRDTMWEKEVSYTKEVSFCENEMKELGDKCFVALFHNFYDEVPEDLGVKFLGIFSEPDWIPAFKEFVQKDNYIANNRFENFKK